MIAILALGCLGFNAIPERWSITRDDPYIYIRLCPAIRDMTWDFGDFPVTDSLAAVGASGYTLKQITDSVIDNYASVTTSYFRFRRLADTDPDVPDRTAEVCSGSTYTGIAGLTTRTTSGSQITHCQVDLDSSALTTAAGFLPVLGHELGHCAGLEHPQDTIHALMSYFEEDGVIRLQTDDRMGLTYLYPATDSQGDEKTTLGLGCGARG